MNPRLYQPSEKRTVSSPSLVRLGHFLGTFVAGPFAIAIPKRKTATPSAPMRLVSATATSAATAIASRHADGARRYRRVAATPSSAKDSERTCGPSPYSTSATSRHGAGTAVPDRPAPSARIGGKTYVSDGRSR